MKFDVSKLRFYEFLLLMLIIFSLIPLNSSRVRVSASEFKISSNTGKSIILMIGDGMGFEQVKLARWTEVGENGSLNMDTLPIHGSVTTQNIYNLTTDSAAAATAMATGIKTRNGKISVTASDEVLKTILEYAAEYKKSTGIVTTTEVSQATPAAFYAHTPSRDFHSEIIEQLVNETKVGLIMGGGKIYFTQEQISMMEEKGYKLVENRSQLLEAEEDTILGLFSYTSIPFEVDRNRDFVPSLAEMTRETLNILSRNSNGFFLMVEGGKIDWACHENNEVNTVLETIEFDKAVGVAQSFVHNNDDTLLIVTADHETGGLNVISHEMNETLPSKTDNTEQAEELRRLRVSNISVLWMSSDHTGTSVPFLGYGNDLLPYNSTLIDNTDIFRILIDYLQLNYTTNESTSDSSFTSTDSEFSSTSSSTTSFLLSTLIFIPFIIMKIRRRKRD